MSIGVFRSDFPRDVEWHALTFLRLHEVFALKAVSKSARCTIRRAFVSYPWNVVLTCKSADRAYRSIEELSIAGANITSICLVRSSLILAGICFIAGPLDHGLLGVIRCRCSAQERCPYTVNRSCRNVRENFESFAGAAFIFGCVSLNIIALTANRKDGRYV